MNPACDPVQLTTQLMSIDSTSGREGDVIAWLDNYLASRGVSANRITWKSYGKERPVAICDDISCWSQNRRAVTVLQ